MAKKTPDDVPNPSSVTNRDILQRLNFLYQASAYLSHIPTSNSTPPGQPGEPAAQLTTQDIAKSYVSCMKTVGQKTTVKMFVSLGYRAV